MKNTQEIVAKTEKNVSLEDLEADAIEFTKELSVTLIGIIPLVFGAIKTFNEIMKRIDEFDQKHFN